MRFRRLSVHEILQKGDQWVEDGEWPLERGDNGYAEALVPEDVWGRTLEELKNAQLIDSDTKVYRSCNWYWVMLDDSEPVQNGDICTHYSNGYELDEIPLLPPHDNALARSAGYIIADGFWGSRKNTAKTFLRAVGGEAVWRKIIEGPRVLPGNALYAEQLPLP